MNYKATEGEPARHALEDSMAEDLLPRQATADNSVLLST